MNSVRECKVLVPSIWKVLVVSLKVMSLGTNTGCRVGVMCTYNLLGTCLMSVLYAHKQDLS